jgi:hypothetical protein
VYPSTSAARDRYVVTLRGPRAPHDPWRYQNLIVEDERTARGSLARTATVFLTGRECPWRCVMCDLWQYTTTTDTPRGAVPAQVAAARRELERRSEDVSQIKLYNAGSFFDPRAVPEGDYDPVAAELTGVARVVVESHPSLIGGDRVDRFLAALDRHCRAAAPVDLEVAMGLETAHPQALEQLHKRMTVDDFVRAAERLRQRRVAVRAFLLIYPPFIPSDEQDGWLLRSIDTAFSCGVSVISLIPTRPGNGAMEALAGEGRFQAPGLDDIERSVALAHTQMGGRGRIFLDLWNLEPFASCANCFAMRRTQLLAGNHLQAWLGSIPCMECGRE